MNGEQQPVVERHQHIHQEERGGIMKKFMMFLMVLVLLAVGAAAGWWWRDKDAKDLEKTKQDQITALQAKNIQLEKDLAAAKKATTTTATSKRPNQAALDSIKAAIVSGNTAALESYMASTIRVIIAASEGVGDRTPTQAISDLKYLDNATDPWDFDLPAATLTKYQAGDYKQYFPTTAYVGRSANKYLISFQFDSNGKISGIFLSNNSDTL